VIKRGLLFVASVLAIMCLLLFRLGSRPPAWLDEGISTHAARLLIEKGVYGTQTTDGIVPFDTGVLTTGPTVVLPIALSFALFGVGMMQARAVSVVYTLLALRSLYALSERLYGRRAAAFVVLILIAAPPVQGASLLLIGRQVLGEPAALAWIALGFWLWFRGGTNGKWPTLIGADGGGMGRCGRIQHTALAWQRFRQGSMELSGWRVGVGRSGGIL